MSDQVDQAIVDWANDQLTEQGLPRDATGIRFGFWISCYSSWTHDYSETATITRRDGPDFTTDHLWGSVIEALPEYVQASERLYEVHDVTCSADDEEAVAEVSWE